MSQPCDLVEWNCGRLVASNQRRVLTRVDCASEGRLLALILSRGGPSMSSMSTPNNFQSSGVVIWKLDSSLSIFPQIKTYLVESIATGNEGALQVSYSFIDAFFSLHELNCTVERCQPFVDRLQKKIFPDR